MADVDSFDDPQIDELARLLYESLRARFGADIVTEVRKRPMASMPDLSRHQMPLLIVCRQLDRTETDDDVMDNEVVTLSVEYYIDATPLDRLDDRWPALRAVWKHCLNCMHAGFDPRVANSRVNRAASGEPDDIVPMLAIVGWRVPTRPVANVRYLLAPTGPEADPQPCFQATVTMRVDETFDYTFQGTFVHDDLLEMRSTVSHEPGSPSADPEPAFESETKFPPRT
jgi:hypothetical protein